MLRAIAASAAVPIGCHCRGRAAGRQLRCGPPARNSAGSLPTGGQRGTEVEVQLAGERLGDAPQLLFYEPGIERDVDRSRPSRTRPRPSWRSLPIAGWGCTPCGIRTASGISNLRLFSVGALPEVERGRAEQRFRPAAEDRARHARSTAWCRTRTSTTTWSKPRRGSGSPPRSRRSAWLGLTRSSIPMWRFWTWAVSSWPAATTRRCSSKMRSVSILAPEDGTYVVQVRDSAYGGSGDCLYRLHVGRFPRPTAVLPAGGRPGETLEVRWLGDVAGERVETVTLPPAAQPDFGLIAQDEHGFAPSPNPFRLVDLGNVLEVEPNDAAGPRHAVHGADGLSTA